MTALLCVMIVSVVAAPARAERLPIRIYTTADGLASPVILDIVPDSRGFVWFATRNGLSRFDGSEFRTYTTDDGLSNPVVNSILETSDGEYWIATNGGGVCRFNVAGSDAMSGSSTAPQVRAPLFTCSSVGDSFLSNRVNVLFEDRPRRLWMGTDHGLFRIERSGNTWRVEPVLLEGLPAATHIASRALYEDNEGRLWVGLASGFLRLDPNRQTTLYVVRGHDVHGVRQIAQHEGALWLRLRFGLLAFRPESPPASTSTVRRVVLNPTGPCFDRDGGGLPIPSGADEACLSDAGDGLSTDFTGAFVRAPDGRLWIASDGALAYLDGRRLTSLSIAPSVNPVSVSKLAVDLRGQLWIATYAGAIKLTPDGMVTYGSEDGLGHLRIHAFTEQAGQLFAVSGDWLVNRFDGRRSEAMKPMIPAGTAFAYYSHGAFLDKTGRWWLLTPRGLYRLKPGATLEQSARQPPEAFYSSANGLPSARVDRLFEDSRGDIWIGSRSRTGVNLSRWERATGRVQAFVEGFGPEHQFPMAFVEDSHGAVWIGFEGGGLARYHGDRFTVFGAADGVPPNVTALHLDGSGRLWIASSSAGVSVSIDAAAPASRFDRYTTAQELSSNNIQCITEDRWGRIYLGTSRGVDRLDPATRRIRHFTTSDGLANDYVTAAMRDSTGALWFGTNDGVSRWSQCPIHPRLHLPSGLARFEPAACCSRFQSWGRLRSPI